MTTPDTNCPGSSINNNVKIEQEVQPLNPEELDAMFKPKVTVAGKDFNFDFSSILGTVKTNQELNYQINLKIGEELILDPGIDWTKKQKEKIEAFRKDIASGSEEEQKLEKELKDFRAYLNSLEDYRISVNETLEAPSLSKKGKELRIAELNKLIENQDVEVNNRIQYLGSLFRKIAKLPNLNQEEAIQFSDLSKKREELFAKERPVMYRLKSVGDYVSNKWKNLFGRSTIEVSPTSKESLFSKSWFKSKNLTPAVETPAKEEPVEDISLEQRPTKKSWWAKSINPELEALLDIKKLNQERKEKQVSSEKKKEALERIWKKIDQIPKWYGKLSPKARVAFGTGLIVAGLTGLLSNLTPHSFKNYLSILSSEVTEELKPIQEELIEKLYGVKVWLGNINNGKEVLPQQASSSSVHGHPSLLAKNVSVYVPFENGFQSSIAKQVVGINPEDTLSKIMMNNIGNQYLGFDNLTPKGQENFIANILSNLNPEQLRDIGVSSMDANILSLNDKIDFNKLHEFTKNMKIIYGGQEMSLLERAKLIK